MRKKKYLTLYYQWAQTGRLHWNGLCLSLGNDKTFTELLSPDSPNGYYSVFYWGWAGEKRTLEYMRAPIKDRMYEFTPLRQNIVLFLAAMNDEL